MAITLPYFYMEHIDGKVADLALDEDTSKHVVQVLRMNIGEKLQLTDGRGYLYGAEISRVQKKSASVKILSSSFRQQTRPLKAVAISLLKNASRFEWFLEKATELGISEIVPLLCERTEKHHYRFDRMKSITVSAMLQSQQVWLPGLSEPVQLERWINGVQYAQKLIAHCETSERHSLNDISKQLDTIILIGPEGDFSPNEIRNAIAADFIPVTLGDTRLRTETAGIVAATLLVR